MNIYEKMGVTPLINASGTVTRLGGALMQDQVTQAIKEASEYSVSLEELQVQASRIISARTQTEAAMVTSGASSALTLGAAAIIAGYNLGKMSRIPNRSEIQEFLVAHNQRNSYDRAITLAGGKLVSVGVDDVTSGAGVRGVELWEYELEKTENTVGLLYTIGDEFCPDHLESVVRKAHELNLKVIVDATASLPPEESLKRTPATGADLVCFSGGKTIGGPQSTGILCGKKDLIASALLQLLDWDDHIELWNPSADLIEKDYLEGMPRHGIGRGMKVSKEEIVGLLKALELFTPESVETKRVSFQETLNLIISGLESLPVDCEIVNPPGKYPVLNLLLNSGVGMNAFQLCQKLREGTPRIFPGHGRLREQVIQINPVCLKEGDGSHIIQRLKEELT